MIALSNSCNKEPEPPIVGISDIIASDNGNLGNGSDVEINFTEQVNQSNVLEYGIILIKAEKANSFTIDDANALLIENYTIGQPADIFPIQGVKLNATSKDSDGDLIREDIDYVVGILTIVKDEEISSNALTLDNKEFRLTTNNLIFDQTPKLDGKSAGSLSISGEGDVFMGSYDIVDHAFGSPELLAPIVQVSFRGRVSEVSEPLSLITGNSLDSKAVSYTHLTLPTKA